MQPWNERAKNFHSIWDRKIAHEWQWAAIPDLDWTEAASVFRLTLHHLVSLHSGLQRLLDARTSCTEADGLNADASAVTTGTQTPARKTLQSRVKETLGCVASLQDGPVVSHDVVLLSRFGESIARVHKRRIRFLGERFPSYSHAIAQCRERRHELFGRLIVLGSTSERVDVNTLVADRKADCQRFVEEQRLHGVGDERDGFFVAVNNGCLCGRDLDNYRTWLARNSRWDFRKKPRRTNVAPQGPSLPLKQLAERLAIGDTQLRCFRKKAGLRKLPKGGQGMVSPSEILKLCDTILQSSCIAATRQAASALRTEYSPSTSIFPH